MLRPVDRSPLVTEKEPSRRSDLAGLGLDVDLICGVGEAVDRVSQALTVWGVALP